ncbi:hypothetical protein GCM10018952_65740 [Streptosporangium vulgare]
MILAAVKREAEPFGQAATQAPQPMQVAASNAESASTFFTGDAVRVGGGAGRDGDEAARLDDAVERRAVHDQVLHHREGRGAPRLDGDDRVVLEVTHVQLAGGGRHLLAVRDTVDDHAAHAADALAAVVVEGDRVVALQDEPLVEDVEHLQEGHVR